MSTTNQFEPRVIRSGEGFVVTMPDQRVEFLLNHDQTGHCVVTDFTVIPGGGPPLHVHARESETWIVTKGQFEFTIGDKVHLAGPGTVLHGPKGVPHTFKNVSETDSKFYMLLDSDNFREFIQEWAVEVNKPEPSMDILVQTLHKFGLDLAGQPPE